MFELSKILANSRLVPQEAGFVTELTKAFEHAQYDEDLVRQYLALAMGRTQKKEFFEPLTQALKTEKEANLFALMSSPSTSATG